MVRLYIPQPKELIRTYRMAKELAAGELVGCVLPLPGQEWVEWAVESKGGCHRI